MNKKIVKLAVIRDNENTKCPFGLSVLDACEQVGDLIDKLAPLNTLGDDVSDQEKLQIKKANLHLFLWNAPGQPCKYAAQIIKDKNKVQCSYDDTAPGIKEKGTLQPSILYSKMFEGPGLSGINSYPLGFYTDYPNNTNGYYGIYSLNSDENVDIVKLSSDEIDEEKK